MSAESTMANQERLQCACFRLDARDCVQERRSHGLLDSLDGDEDACLCACHEPNEDDDEEEDPWP